MGQAENYSIRKAPFSTDKHAEFAPVFWRDGVVFCTDREQGLFSYSGTEGTNFIDLFYLDTTQERRRPKPEIFSEEIHTKFNEGPATFNSTGDMIYFTRNLYVEGKMEKLSSQWNKLGLFSARLINGKWSNIKEFRFNNEWFNITTSCLCPEGKRIYFASDMPDGYGGLDLYYSEWKDGYWEEPVNMGPLINTSGNESYPFTSPTGDFFFSSDGHQGHGGKDIFYTTQVRGKWIKPEALEAPINSEHDDFGFTCDTLLIEGYFSSDRDGTLDIFEFKTLFPQVFYPNYQRENNFCYAFEDSGSIELDTIRMGFKWIFGDGETELGPRVNHCYPGAGSVNVKLDIVDRNTGELFFNKLNYSLNIKQIEQAYIYCPDVAIKGKEIDFSGDKSYLPGYKIEEFTWDFGDGSRAHGNKVRHSYENEGEYEINLFLRLRKRTTGESAKTFVTRKIKIVGNTIEKQYYIAESNGRHKYTDLEKSENTEVTIRYSAEKEFQKGAVFSLELTSSTEKLSLNDPLFSNLPDKYILSERYDMDGKTFSYTIEEQLKLMHLFPAYREVRKLGFNDARAKLFTLKDSAEKELISLLKSHETSTDRYFDTYDRLTTDAYIMMDQIVKFMVKYPSKRLRISVHTDNIGSASRNLSTSQRKADRLKEYLLTRGIEDNRIIATGYGETKPVATNDYELERRMNRRVEFRVAE